MAEEVQNVRIKFISDTDGLKEASKEFQQLTDNEKEAVQAFNKFNSEAKKQEGILEKLQREEKLLLQSRLKSNDPKAIATYNKQLESTRGQIRSMTAETQKSSSAFASVGASIVAAFSVAAITNFVGKVIQTTSEFQKLEAVLTNTLGSQSGAKRALADIQQFASTTNFGVLELTNGFVKLANSGFTPTKDNLRQLADLANSTGKSFDQLVEGLLDANTFQFERLKEFGIKASQEGDKIKFTFKGVTTEVDKTASSVQDYILSLGDLEGVTGSTAAISETLGGQLSNLGDNFDVLFNALGTANNGVLSDTISLFNNLVGSIGGYLATSNQLSDALTKGGLSEFNVTIAKGDLAVQAYFEALNKAIDSTEDFAKKGKIVSNEYSRQNELFLKGTLNVDEFSAREALLRNALADIAQQRIDSEKKVAAETERIRAEAEAKAKKDAEKAKKLRDKEFKEAMDLLKRQEDVARRENKVEGGGTSQDLEIQEAFQAKRLSIIQKYLGKQNVTYEDGALRLREIEKEETEFLIEEENKRAEALIKVQKERADDSLKVLDETEKKRLLQNSSIASAETDALRTSFTKREITFKEYQEKESQVKFQAARSDLKDQITIDKEKLMVENITAEERLKIEKDLQDKEAKLRDLDFEQFAKNEEQKTKKAKEEAELRKMIANAAFEAGVSIINSLAEISSNRIEQDIIDLKAKQEYELSLVGDNKERQEQINQKYSKKEKELKAKQAKEAKDLALFNAGIDAAASIVKTLASVPYPANIVLAGLAAATAYAKVSAIKSTPVPKFFHGTDYVERGLNPIGRDTIPAYLHEGERVVPAYVNKKLEGIPNSELPNLVDIYKNRIDYDGITKSISMVDYSGRGNNELIQEVRNLGKKIQKIPVPQINIDKKGIRTLIVSEGTETEFTNNYFRV